MRFIEYLIAATALAGSAMFGAAITKRTARSYRPQGPKAEMAAVRRDFKRMDKCTTLKLYADMNPEALGSPGLAHVFLRNCDSMAGQDSLELMEFILETVQGFNQAFAACECGEEK